MQTSEDQISIQVIAKYSISFFTVRFLIIFTSQDRLLQFTRGRECYRPKCLIYINKNYHIFKLFKFISTYYIWFFPIGELIGVEYLYAQTGQVLQKASSDEDNETSLQVPDGDYEDEGFQVSIITYHFNTLRNFTPHLI